MTSSNEIECTTVQPSTATASSSVKCLYFGGDTSFGTAKKAVNGAGAGFIQIDVTAPTTGLIQVMVPIAFTAQEFVKYGID